MEALSPRLQKQSRHSHRLKGDMHEMDIATKDSLKEELINRDPEFRELAREHHKYEERLTELSALAYPSDEEQLEETTLKKKKLALKDQMYSIMTQYQKSHSLSH
jgi:uncharacterized protein YdcH (DUF465 family)